MSFSLKYQKIQGYLFKTGRNLSVIKTLVWSVYINGGPPQLYYLKKE